MACAPSMLAIEMLSQPATWTSGLSSTVGIAPAPCRSASDASTSGVITISPSMRPRTARRTDVRSSGLAVKLDTIRCSR